MVILVDHRVAQAVLSRVPMSLCVAPVISLHVSALELTTATCNAETFRKTMFVKPDWDNLVEQWNSGNCAATSVVSSNVRLMTQRYFFKPLCP